jgi:hypothetical protein
MPLSCGGARPDPENRQKPVALRISSTVESLDNEGVRCFDFPLLIE